MKPRTTILAAILGLTALVSGSVGAEVDQFSCGKLHDYWKEYKKGNHDSSRDWGKAFHYLGYTAGLVNHYRSVKYPTNGTPGQHAYVVGKWLEDHPEKWHEPRVWCVYWALTEAYGLKD